MFSKKCINFFNTLIIEDDMFGAFAKLLASQVMGSILIRICTPVYPEYRIYK